MFDKPNTTGFIYVSHYLLIIYDAERFKKVVEWPVICKKTETKYRNSVKDYLNVIALENPDIGFPRVVTTYLHHASGTKFITIMWKLSQLALKMYIMRNGEHEVIFAPKSSIANDSVKTYLQQSKANINCDILSRHRNYVQMEKAANFALTQEKEYLTKIKAELFDKKQSLAKCASSAPVTESIKQCLTNVEDTDIVSMWKNSLNKNIQYIRKRYMMLSDLERTCEKTSGIISNLLNDSKALDSKQLEKINCSLISELSFPPDVEHCLYHLYNDNRLIYHNFVRLLTLILYQIYQCLRKDDLVDLSQCLLQVEASTEDMKSMCNVFKTFLANIISSTEEMQNDLCVKSIERISEDKNVLPFVKNVLLMSSPLIKINTNCANQRNELQFTPTEINSSMMSLQSTTQSNSSDFNLDTITKGFINWSEESSKVSYSSIQFTPIKRNVSKVASQQQVKNKLDHKVKVNKPELDEFTEVQIVNDDDKSTIIKHENDSKRRSISDLVERYKKILEVSNSVTTKLENTYVEHEIE
ncbi:hypothetical protein G5I_06363 [Acromyrmex echinatior]|uniref:HAUS augmin-like complex subunit 6 N-terminal domain-containing protein n=1 Tax=Acromyrmex echinatior TaxID=103372 RepID=F4WKU3_ACREC|nr:hypothetical protein G5I_06363 [Acromyrmex echinatior]